MSTEFYFHGHFEKFYSICFKYTDVRTIKRFFIFYKKNATRKHVVHGRNDHIDYCRQSFKCQLCFIYFNLIPFAFAKISSIFDIQTIMENLFDFKNQTISSNDLIILSVQTITTLNYGCFAFFHLMLILFYTHRRWSKYTDMSHRLYFNTYSCDLWSNYKMWDTELQLLAITYMLESRIIFT